MQHPSEWGAAVRQARLARRLSQDELAALAGVTPSTIQRWEGGQVEPRSASKRKFAHALGFASVEAMTDAWKAPRGSAPLRSMMANTFAANVDGRLEDLRPPEVTLLPVYGWGACGDPRDQESAPDPVDYEYPPLGKERLIGHRGLAIRVRGESMANRGIHDGDTVWVNPDSRPRVGRVVLAQVFGTDGDEEVGMVVKLWKRDDGGDRLWGDGQGEEGCNPVICSRFVLIGPVVWVQPAGYPPL